MLSEHARALVDEARESRDDEHVHRERLRARVLAATVAATVGSTAAATAGGLGAGKVGAAAGKLSLLGKLTLVVLFAAVGAAAIGLGVARSGGAAAVAEPRVARVVATLAGPRTHEPSRAVAPGPTAAPEPVTAAPAEPSAAASELAPASGGVGEPSAPTQPPRAPAKLVAAEPASSDDVAAEAALLGRARAAHQASLDGEALRLLDEHEAKFARGVLTSERNTLRLLVECRLGRPAAKARAAALVEQGSTTVFAQKLKVACGL